MTHWATQPLTTGSSFVVAVGFVFVFIFCFGYLFYLVFGFSFKLGIVCGGRLQGQRADVGGWGHEWDWNA